VHLEVPALVVALLMVNLTAACFARSAERQLDGDWGGAANSDQPGQKSRKPGTKGRRFAGWRPMPDHIALSGEDD